jgi:hypothetical protein
VGADQAGDASDEFRKRIDPRAAELVTGVVGAGPTPEDPGDRLALYRFVGPKGELRADATKLLKRKAQNVSS